MSNEVSVDEVPRDETQRILQIGTHCFQSLELEHFTQLEGKEVCPCHKSLHLGMLSTSGKIFMCMRMSNFKIPPKPPKQQNKV